MNQKFQKFQKFQLKVYCTQIYDLGFKPLRPRGKMEPLKSPEIRVEISRYEIRDSDFDPYAVYILKASKGKITAEKERRFKEFEKLNKAIKKFLPKDAILPEASSKIGVRNLTSSFLQERVTKLNEYLHKLLESPELQENEDFLFFLGLLPSKNPLDDQIFNDAFRRTKYDLHCWGYINFDKSEDAISKLVTREVWCRRDSVQIPRDHPQAVPLDIIQGDDADDRSFLIHLFLSFQKRKNVRRTTDVFVPANGSTFSVLLSMFVGRQRVKSPLLPAGHSVTIILGQRASIRRSS